MLKSKTLLTEDLSKLDWSQFICKAVLNEVTGHIQIVCDIRPDNPHRAAPREGDPPETIKGWEEWNKAFW